MRCDFLSDENKKETDKIIDNLATTIVDNIQSITDNCIKKAKYDKSFNTTVLGVNQNFSDKVPEDKQRELIEKFKIPDEYSSPVYYTFMINGEYYVKASKNEYYLYDEICVRVPNGSWDNMYIEINLPRDKESDCIGEWSDKGKNSAVIINTDKPNTIEGDNGFCAGRGNTIKGDYNFGGGGSNKINGNYNFFVGSSTVNGNYNISGGISSVINGAHNISGGWLCNIDGSYNLFSGVGATNAKVTGNYNTSLGDRCSIDGNFNFCGGQLCKIEHNSEKLAKPKYNFCYGYRNSIKSSNHHSTGSAIVGYSNEIYDSAYSFILGNNSKIKNIDGERNYILGSEGIIGSDESEQKRWALDCFILGDNLTIRDGHKCVLIGGNNNKISTTENDDDAYNYIDYDTHVKYCAVLGGNKNRVNSAALNSVIIGGEYNIMRADNSSILSGHRNAAHGWDSCIVGGYNNTTIYQNAVTIGGHDNHSGYNSVLIGGAYNTSVTNAGGGNAIISGYYNRTIDKDGLYPGSGVILSGHYCTLEESHSLVTCGDYNRIVNISDDRFSVGNGGNEDSRSNAFRVTSDGNIYAGAAVNSTGADFAEMREWSDGNPNNEDRRGLFVVYDDSIDYKIGEYAKIRIANENDDLDDVLGIISSNPTVVGNTASETWQGMWQRDIFGNVITEEKHFPAETKETENPETGEKETVVVIPEHTEIVPVVNPMYDGTKEYKGRKDRPEWGVVGMLGMVVTVDDGSCKMLSYCKVGQDGKATHSENKTRFRVVARLDETHIAVEIKP